MSPIKLPAIAIALTLATTVASEVHAQECGMGEVDFYVAEEQAVARADGMLREGDTRGAAALLRTMWPRISEAVPVASSVPAIAEGVRLMALATTRTSGESARSMAWGVSRLRMLAALNPTSELAKTDLGEALVRVADTREEGAAILEELDLFEHVASPEGYAALAGVRAAKGDPRGVELASIQCARVASNVEAQCGVLAATSVPPVTAAR